MSPASSTLSPHTPDNAPTDSQAEPAAGRAPTRTLSSFPPRVDAPGVLSWGATDWREGGCIKRLTESEKSRRSELARRVSAVRRSYPPTLHRFRELRLGDLIANVFSCERLAAAGWTS